MVSAMPESCACRPGRGVGVSPSHSGVCLGTQLAFSLLSFPDKETKLPLFRDMQFSGQREAVSLCRCGCPGFWYQVPRAELHRGWE